MNNGDEDNQEIGHNNQANSATSERLQNITRRGLNTMTGGAWNKARNAPIVGAAARKAEDKLANKIGNTKLGKKLNNKPNHQKPENLGANPNSEANKNDVGPRNLQNSLANKAKNLWNQRKKKKKNNNDSKDTDNSNNNQDNNQGEDSNSLSLEEELAQARLRRIKIKIMITAAIVAFAFLLFFAFIIAIMGLNVGQSIPAINSSTYGTDEFQSTYPKDSREYKNEIAYYEKLNSLKKRFNSEYGEELKSSYLHATLIYVYYLVDITESSDYDEEKPIDYVKMSSMADKIYELMKPGEDKKNVDYEINGVFYNNLMNSDDFRNYYKDLLKKEDIKEILNGIFDLAKEIDSIEIYDDTTITSETSVTVNDSKPKKISINEYLSQSIYASTNKTSNKEAIKAYTIAYSTNIVSDNKKLTISSNNAVANNPLCSIKEGCSYDSNGNLVDGPGKRSSENSYYYNGGYYYKKPLTSSEQSDLNKSINSIFGYVLVNQDGTYPKLDLSKLDGFGDGDYKEILKQAYGNLELKNVGENSYILDGSYGDKKVLTEVIFYDQKNYPNSRFCGIKGYTIGGSGCGVTAMAIVASTYENNKKYDPIYMNEEARKRGMCGTSGTAQAFFQKEASAMKYKYSGGSKYNKSLLNSVLKHLSQGHLVVVRIGSGHFTGGGHYMVLGGVDPETQKVYVYDPNNRSNKSYRKTGNGWYSFNDIIVKEAYNFYIIWKG